jgi:phospholipid/cholesterol/gamma-HCH transport system ATP-binding protein
VPTIHIAGLEKRFGRERVLRGLDLEVGDGESVVLIGASGAGKTLLLKLILDLMRPTAGTIEIGGVDVVKARRAEREKVEASIGTLFQRAALFDSLTVWQNVAFRLLRSTPKDECRELAIRRLDQVGLGPDTADLMPAELSGGMQKRVGIARAVAADPAILLLDEPTAGLDPIMSSVICELIRDNVRRLGATAVSIVSDLAVAVRVADRVAMIHDGAICWQGPAEYIEMSGNEHVDAFIHKWQTEKAAAH